MLHRSCVALALLVASGASCGLFPDDGDSRGPGSDARTDDVFRVLSISPEDGSTLLSNDVVVKVSFSHAFDAASLVYGESVRVVELGDAGDETRTVPMNQSWGWEGAAYVLSMYPGQSLPWERPFSVVIEATLESEQGHALDQSYTSRFTTPAEGGASAAGVYFCCSSLAPSGSNQQISLRRVGLDGSGGAAVADLSARFAALDPGSCLSGMPSPDGSSLLLLLHSNNNFSSALITVDTSSGATQMLADDIVASSEDQLSSIVDISPAGVVAYTGPLVNSQRKQISLVNLDGSARRTLFTDLTAIDHIGGLAWDAAGSALMVLSTSGSNAGIFSVDVATAALSQVKLLNQQSLLGMAERLAYHAGSGHAAISFRKNFGTATENLEILAWSDLGAEPSFNSSTAAINESYPFFTPDGGRLLFNRAGEVASYTFNGGSTGTFLSSGGAVGAASFTADGQTVVFIDSSGNGEFALFARTGTGTPLKLADSADLGCSPDFGIVVQ